MKNRTIKIRRNYGVLGAEKRAIYTYEAEHVHATWSEEIAVEIPDGWELCESNYGWLLAEAPWGETYMISDILAGNENPCFIAVDPNYREIRANLKVIKEPK